MTDNELPAKEQVDSPACSKCKGKTQFQTQLPSWGETPGYRIYRCGECGKVDWVELLPAERK
jgi:hypothetical protein